MPNLDERAKEALKKLTDTDGKIIVTDDMPDDLKEAINYINENNIDVYSADFGQEFVDDSFEESEDDSNETLDETFDDLDEDDDSSSIFEDNSNSVFDDDLDEDEAEELDEFL